MALSQSALSELLDAFRTGDGVDLIRESVHRAARADRVRSRRGDRRRPLRTHRDPCHRTQRHPAAAVGDQGRRRRAADPEAAQGLVLPVDPRAPPPDRPGPVRGGDGGLRPRRLDPQRRRPGRRARRRLRHLQVRGVSDLRRRSTRSSARSAPGAWTTSSSPTSISTRPTCTCATPPRQVISMAVVVATGITADGSREVLGLDVGDSEDETFWRGFLRSLKSAAWAGCSWSSPTSTPGWSRR